MVIDIAAGLQGQRGTRSAKHGVVSPTEDGPLDLGVWCVFGCLLYHHRASKVGTCQCNPALCNRNPRARPVFRQRIVREDFGHRLTRVLAEPLDQLKRVCLCVPIHRHVTSPRPSAITVRHNHPTSNLMLWEEHPQPQEALRPLTSRARQAALLRTGGSVAAGSTRS